MNTDRFDAITARYPHLRVAIVGDFCLDRYLEIDLDRAEISIETNLPVHNVTRIRSQPGAAGTILNNLVALGVGGIQPVGFCGDDGEGYELTRAMQALPGVRLGGFIKTSGRHTFTYTKPLVCRNGKEPQELNRLDIKNWSPTPGEVRQQIVQAATAALQTTDATIVLDQVDIPDTGVVVPEWLDVLRNPANTHGRLVIGDSRRGLRGWPPVILKMNAAELAKLSGESQAVGVEAIRLQARSLAHRMQTTVFITMAERGIVAARHGEDAIHVPALPIRGPIDIVGAGDAVTANLIVALAAGATLAEAMEIAMGAASVVIHQLGTTGTASVGQIRSLIL